MGTTNFGYIKSAQHIEFITDDHTAIEDIIEYATATNKRVFEELNESFNLPTDTPVYSVWKDNQLVGAMTIEYGYYENALVHYLTLDEFIENSSNEDMVNFLIEAGADEQVISDTTGLEHGIEDLSGLFEYGMSDRRLDDMVVSIVERYENEVVNDYDVVEV
jgi:hypothetical protein